MPSRLLYLFLFPCLSVLVCCGKQPANSPYPPAQDKRNIHYASFSERPKHLDPAVSYSSNEYQIIGQIYEPPLQYHFLKRPYELVPLTAQKVPEAEYYDATGQRLGPDAAVEQIARVHYRIEIQPGIQYQPHPAFVKDARDTYLYHHLGKAMLGQLNQLADFEKTASRELVAEDYVYQIKRMAHPGVHSPLAGLMTQYIAGLRELAEQLRQLEANDENWIDLRSYTLPGARVLDRYSYELVLKKKYPQFIYWLSMSFFAPMPWEADRFYSQPGLAKRNISLDWYPVGTGPYMLIENNPNRRMVLQRNPNFRAERYPSEGATEDAALRVDAGKKMPFIDTAIYSLEKEAIPEWNKFLQGYYDTSGIISDSFDQAIQFDLNNNPELTEQMRSRQLKLLTAVTLSTYYLGFNMEDEVIGGYDTRSRLLRRAISIAVDYEEYIQIFANGRGISAQGPLPPGIFGHRPVTDASGVNPYVYRWEQGRAVRRSIAEARALLDEAGYTGGRNQDTGNPLILYLDTAASDPGSKAVFDWFRKQFAKLDINLVIRSTDYNRFQEKMRNGTGQLFMWGWNADYPDPENFLFLLYGPNAKVLRQGENASNYQNPEYDELFVQMSSMENGPQRQAVIDAMLDMVRRDAPWLWGMHPVAYSLHHVWYSNARPNLMANNTLKYKRIDPVERSRLRREWNRAHWEPVALVLALFVFAIVFSANAWWRRQQRPGL